jgi:hypothetical protein
MLTCKDTAWVCSEELERPLRLGERASMHLHLMLCAGCSNYRGQLGVLRRAMQAYANGEADAGASESETAQDL